MPRANGYGTFVELICMQCGKHLIVKYGLRHRKFCSNSCKGKSELNISNNLKKAVKSYIENRKGKTFEEYYGKERAKEISEKLRQSKLGDKNPTKRQEVKDKISNKFKQKREEGWISPLKGRKHTEEQNKNTSIATKKAMSRPDVKLNYKKSEKQRRASMKKWFSENKEKLIEIRNKPETRKKMRESHIKAMAEGKYKNHKNTDIERFIEKILIDYGFKEEIDYFKQYPFPEEHPKYSLDFYLPLYKLNIEGMGCYWHKCKKCNMGEGRESDKNRIQLMIDNNISVLNLWSHSMKTYTLFDFTCFMRDYISDTFYAEWAKRKCV